MPKRKKPELDPKEQFKRFQETAKEHGVDTRDGALERTFTALAKEKAKGGEKKRSR